MERSNPMNNTPAFTRSYRLLRYKFFQYLMPTTLTVAALSLSEFVDSMVVSRLLGSRAMAIISLGIPATLIVACCYALLGNGGATVYARALGSHENEKAGSCFLTAIATSVVVGFAITGLGMLFFRFFLSFFCKDASLMEDFTGYLRVLLFSAPLLTITLSFVEFLPPSGLPAWATIINTVANCVNLLMDFVYIRFFHMGVEGAAYATLTGYAVGLILVIILFISKRIRIPGGGGYRLGVLKEILVTGSSSSMNQLGFALKFSVSNALAATLGGTAGVVAFSLCIQTLSITAIFIMGAAATAVPLIAVLHSQNDHHGVRYVMLNTLKVTTLCMGICTVLILFFPRQFASIYNVTAPQELSLGIHALRLFAATFLFRNFCIVMMRCLQAVGKEGYAFFISLFDGCIGIIPISYLCCGLLGLDGVWGAYPATSILLAAIIILYNLRLVRRSNGYYQDILLTIGFEPAVRSMEYTILNQPGLFMDKSQTADPETPPAGFLSEKLETFCKESGVSLETSIHSALVTEEMISYTQEKAKVAQYMDIIARNYPDRVEITFRSLGDPVNPLSGPAETPNLQLLRGMSDSLTWDYIMGMNCTRAVISVESGDKEAANPVQDAQAE